MKLLDVFNRRYTARSFNGIPVDPEAIERILEAARLAPSAKNRQVWRFIAITRDEIKSELKDACFGDERIVQASCVIAACTTNIQYTLPNGQLSYPLDLAFAVSHMAIQAAYEEIDSAIYGTFNEDSVKKMLSVPYSMKVVLLIALGYSDEKNYYKDRLAKNRVISYNHW